MQLQQLISDHRNLDEIGANIACLRQDDASSRSRRAFPGA
jgi:hypothetical protein